MPDYIRAPRFDRSGRALLRPPLFCRNGRCRLGRALREIQRFPGAARNCWVSREERSTQPTTDCQTAALSLHAADRAHGRFHRLDVGLPERREVGAVQISEIERQVGERGGELLAVGGLVDRAAQRGYDRGRRAFRGEQPDPQIIFDVVAELPSRRRVRRPRTFSACAEQQRAAPTVGLGRRCRAVWVIGCLLRAWRRSTGPRHWSAGDEAQPAGGGGHCHRQMAGTVKAARGDLGSRWDAAWRHR
jgi:hypothetical protein